MAKIVNFVKAALLTSALALTALAAFPGKASALWVACWNPGGDACTVTFYNDDGQRTAEFYYNNWAMGN